ncbi:MAG: TetR family transcriptional regulator [Burkholderiales bacterium 66-5]|nr:MAG: TetR family transcriptional regulator [Burkholderiales bacterium 66-5]
MQDSIKPASRKRVATTGTRRLAPQEREQQIVEKAIEHFTRHGFAGSTRELARELGVTQPLLYRYFPNKEALIDRVYHEVFSGYPNWEGSLTDRALPLVERLHSFYTEYARVILREEWIRIFIFAGLTREGINSKYLSRLRTRVFLPVLAEIRHEFGIADPETPTQLEHEVELLWAFHASFVYLGIRKWIYGLKIPKDIDGLIKTQLTSFLHGAPETMRQIRGTMVPSVSKPKRP